MTTLYSISKTGKTTEWKAVLVPLENCIEIQITAGYTDGKKVVSTRVVNSGKNIGRSNETTLEEQANLELERLYQKQRDKGYKEDISEVCINKTVGDILKPMLASKYPDKAHKLPQKSSNIALQPKVDGIRCFVQKLSDGSIRLTSRSGKVFNPIPHLVEEASRILSEGDILDGELYIPGLDLQEIMSIISPTKNIKEELLQDVRLYWYDFIPHNQEQNSFRTRFYENTLEVSYPIHRLDTRSIGDIDTSSEDFLDILESTFDEFISSGYEGLMLRDLEAPYFFGRRNDCLQKYKKMESDEFQIVDIIPSEQDEAPRFICDLRNGNTVTVRLKGNKEDNLIYLSNKENYIGKWLTINYQTKTKTNSLQFPVGIVLREGTVEDGLFIPNI